MNLALHRVSPGSCVKLDELDARATPLLCDDKRTERAQAEARHAENVVAMRSLQLRLWAEGKQSLLVVLQGMDTAGKDGTIRHVFGPLNPQGVRVHGFKVPTELERRHDFLWRVHAVTPPHGLIGVFNRSHYEDVGVVRVHKLVPKDVWSSRFERINAFERTLTDNGTTIIKIFLHISKEEQKNRLQERLDRPDKHWKFSMGDLMERKVWDEYQTAYSDAIERCSTQTAPWFVVPADRKWYRNFVVSSIVRATLEQMNPLMPVVDLDPTSIVID